MTRRIAPSRWGEALVAAALLVEVTIGGAAVLTLAGCARQDCAEADGGVPVDPVLLGFISRARSAHHLADGREDAGDLSGALAALRAVTDGPLPPAREAAEVREVLADTRARAADLASRLGDFAGAEAEVKAGLELVPETSYFRGHLFEVRGLVEERLGKKKAQEGDPAGAARARERALAAFEEAMRIQGAVIDSGTQEP